MSCISSKICTRCGLTKPLSEFHVARKGKDGLRADCRTCCAERSRLAYLKSKKAGADGFKHQYREKELKKRYGIGIDEYEVLFEMQGGRCGICGSAETGRKTRANFDVDHSHETGEVRGLLCSRCNSAIGFLGDNPDVLRKAAEYLERAKWRRKIRS